MDEVKIAQKYISKCQRARQDGIEFSIGLLSFRNLMMARKCQYTGITLTDSTSKAVKATDRTIDRIDHNKGYVTGNVVAVCHAANRIKASWENPNNPLDAMMVKKICDKELRSTKND